MYKQITLRGFVDSPSAWQNLVRMLYDENKHFDVMLGVPPELINEALREFDAHYVIDKIDDPLNRRYYLTFDTEQGYMMFLLKWG